MKLLVTELSNIIKSIVKEKQAIVLRMSSLMLWFLESKQTNKQTKKQTKKTNYMNHRIFIKTLQIKQMTCSRQDHIYNYRWF